MHPDLRIRPRKGEIWTELHENLSTVIGLVSVLGSASSSYWVVKDIMTDKEYILNWRHIGDRLNEMEVLAWISNLPERIIA